MPFLPSNQQWGDDGGGHLLVWMEWRPAGWSLCLPLLIFPCTIKSRSSLLAPVHPRGPGKRAAKRLWWWCLFFSILFSLFCSCVVCFCCVRFSFLQYWAKRLAGKNVSEVTSSVSSGM